MHGSNLQHTWGGKYSAKQNKRNAYETARNELFRDYELMDTDPIISSALDVYSDESTIDNVENEILQINQIIQKSLKFYITYFMTFLT